MSKESGCYKLILDCAEHNVAFYEKCGLTRKEIQMVRSVHSAGASTAHVEVLYTLVLCCCSWRTGAAAAMCKRSANAAR